METGRAQSINTSLDMLNSLLNYRSQKESRDANLAMGLLRLQTARINREQDNLNRQREIKINQFNQMRDELSKVMNLNNEISKVGEENQSSDSNRLLANIHNKQLRDMTLAREEIKGYDKQIQYLNSERDKYNQIRTKVIAEYDTAAENGLNIGTLTAKNLERFASIEDFDKFYENIAGKESAGKYKKGVYELANALRKDKYTRTLQAYDRIKQEERDRYNRGKDKAGSGKINMNELLRPLAGGLNPQIDLWNKELEGVEDSNLSKMTNLPLSIKTKAELKGWLKANGNNFANSLFEGDVNDGFLWSNKIDDKKALYYYEGYTDKDKPLAKRKQFASLLFQRFAEHPEILKQLDSSDKVFTASNPKKVKAWEDMLVMNQKAMHGYGVVDQLEQSGVIPKSIFDTNESPGLSEIEKAYQASLSKPVSKSEDGIGNKFLNVGKELVTGGSIIDIVGAFFKKEEETGKKLSNKEFVNAIKKEPEQTLTGKILNKDNTTSVIRLKEAKTELEKAEKDLMAKINKKSNKTNSGILSSILFNDNTKTDKVELKKKLSDIRSKLKAINNELLNSKKPSLLTTERIKKYKEKTLTK